MRPRRTKPPEGAGLNRPLELPSITERARRMVVILFGAFLGLTLVKFGNPVILDHLVHAPKNGLELLFGAWPIRWVFDSFRGPGLLLALVALTVVVWAFGRTFPITLGRLTQNKPAMLSVAALAGWYGWQWVASMETVSEPLTSATLSQFTLCLICFLFGLFCLNAVERSDALWWGLLAGLVVVLWSGLDQRFGGLEATRRMIYEQGAIENYPEEFLRRISTGRVFGTLFYPNSLAGVILIMGPAALMFVHRITVRRGNVLWGLAVGLLGYLSAACLYWSGSKSGWLIAATMVLLTILRLPLARRSKWLVLGLVGVMALGAFGVRFAGYFQKGATSVVARFDYWRAAVQVGVEHPLTGTGPGTFQVPYAKLKAPESEMARLAHNDYLQQASDSGFPGFLFYSGFLLGSVALIYRRSQSDTFRFSVWLGLLAWALHSFVEFGLYIPAIAWPAFTLLGWLVGNDMDTNDTRN